MSNIITAEQNAVAVVEQSPEQRAALALNSDARGAELRALAAQSADITEIKNADGRDQAHQIAMTLRKARTTIKGQAEDAREDAKNFQKAVIAAEKTLIAIIEPEETRVLALRDAWDTEQQRIKDAAIAAERARVEGIEALIAGINETALRHAASGADTIAAALENLSGLALDEATYHEFVGQAAQAKADAMATLGELLAAARQREQEAAEARERIEAEKRAAEAERQRLTAEAAAMDRVRAELAAAQARLEQARLEQEAKDRAAQAERDRQQRQLDDERAAFAAEQAAAALAAKAAADLARDHAEALELNAAHDVERLERDHAEALEQDAIWSALAAGERVSASIADGLIAEAGGEIVHALAGAALLDADVDDDDDEFPSDEKLVEVVAQSFGMTSEQAVERLARFAMQYK